MTSTLSYPELYLPPLIYGGDQEKTMSTTEKKGVQPLLSEDDDDRSDPAPPHAKAYMYHDDPSYEPTPAAPFLQVVVQQSSESRPNTWLIPAILVTLCCFVPTGIFAIIYANSANEDARYGNMADAKKNARKAKRLTIVSITVGIAVTTVILVASGLL